MTWRSTLGEARHLQVGEVERADEQDDRGHGHEDDERGGIAGVQASLAIGRGDELGCRCADLVAFARILGGVGQDGEIGSERSGPASLSDWFQSVGNTSDGNQPEDVGLVEPGLAEVESKARTEGVKGGAEAEGGLRGEG